MDGTISPDRLPPGPKGQGTPIARARMFAGFFFDALGFVEKRFATYGDVYHVAGRGPGLYVFKHPDHLRALLSTEASRFRKEHSAFEQLGRVLGEGLLTTDGDVWKRQRRLVQPGFAKPKLARYAEVMVDETARSMRSLEGERDMSRELMELTLRAVSRALFGHDASTDVATVGHAMRSLQTSLATSEVLPGWLPFVGRRSVDRSIAALDGVVYGLIDRRRAELDRGASPREDVLDALLSAVDTEGVTPGSKGDRLTKKEVRDQLMTLFLAGHETTSHALSWTLYLLSQNPGVREQVIAEVRGVLGTRLPSIEDLPKLPLVEQVFKEALRLYPPAYILARRASADVEIGGYRLPAGAEAIAWIYFTHRDERWFEDPHAFKPERFAPAREGQIPPFAFVPFGAGPRACIGKGFAMVEGTLMLAALSQRFRFGFAPGAVVTPNPRITMHPKRGLPMRVRPIL